ncbi:MAG: membrane protein insertase YidC [bacterium]|jgi:YidC/Oxa1 family membrane protein insertase
MADINNGPNKLNDSEPHTERRMLLAFLLMGAILFATPYFYRLLAPPAPAPEQAAVAAEQAKPGQAQAAESASPEAANVVPAAKAGEAPPAVPATPVSAEQEEVRTIETDLYRVTLSNRGAVVRSWILKKYSDRSGKPLDLVNPVGSEKSAYPFSLAFKGQKPSADLNSVLWAVRPDTNNLSVVFEYSDGHTSARKTFSFKNNSYLSEFSSEVTEDGQGIAHLVAWRGGFGDSAVQNAAGAQHAVYFDVASKKLVQEAAKAAKDGPVDNNGQYSFAGVQDTYFAAVFMPRGGNGVVVRLLSDDVPTVADQEPEPHVGVAVGGAPQQHLEVFAGPKDVKLLQKVDPRLAQLVDFGTWFGWLAKPLFTILTYIHDNLIPNYGWAIIVFTIILNIAMVPLRFSSIKSMKKMQDLQPQIQAINAKYKGVGLRDPRNQEKNAELMELYKRHGVNPVGGCLPMLLQMPIFIAFYTVLTVAIELRGADWLWIKDLSHFDPLYILPIAMVVAQYAQQKMTPNPSGDPAQQRMLLFMPLIFGFMFMKAASGLVLYWFTSNLVGVAIQFAMNKIMGVGAVAQPQPAPAAAVAGPQKRRTGSRK